MSSNTAVEFLEEQLKAAEERFDKLHEEYSAAFATLAELETRVQGEGQEIDRLKQSIAVLKGEITPERDKNTDTSEEVPVNQPEREDNDVDVGDMTPEEFDEYRKERQKANRKRREAENKANNPYAEMQCKSCGTTGSLHQSFKTLKGKQIPVIACGECSSVSILGR